MVQYRARTCRDASLTLARRASSRPSCSSPTRYTNSSAPCRPSRFVALVINVAIALYLLLAKRLFGLRGGTAAEREDGNTIPVGRRSFAPRRLPSPIEPAA